MAVSNDFLEYILDQLSHWGDVTSRRLFGGAGLYRDGKIFALLSDNIMYLKVDETNTEKYVKSGSSPFKPFPNRPTIMSYFEVPPDILEDSEKLIEWAKEALSIQQNQK